MNRFITILYLSVPCTFNFFSVLMTVIALSSTQHAIKSPISFAQAVTTTGPTLGPFSIENIIMKLSGNGLEPLSPQDIKSFERNTRAYIMTYFNETTPSCDTCLQKDIDVVDVSIEVQDQDPRFVADADADGSKRRRLHSLKNDVLLFKSKNHRDLQTDAIISLTYTQTTTYRKINSLIEDPNIEDIMKEPFNNVLKRTEFQTFLKQSSGAAFQSLSLVLAPSIKEPSVSPFGIGVIAAMVSGGLVGAVLVVFLICKVSRRGSGVSKYSYDDHYQVSTKSRRSSDHHSPNGNHARHPSQVQVPDVKDEVSTMVDPVPQYGVFNGNRSLTGYNNTPSIASYDPDYVGIYNRGSDDPSLVSSAGGTLGSNTQKSKFSAMGSTFTPAQTMGQQSIFTDDEQSFEQHLKNRKNGKQREQYFDIYAPGGRLGVVIDTPNSGAPIVHNIKDTCPIADQLRVGDKLIAVDDEDVRSMTAVKVSRLISQKSNNPTRKFTIARVIEE